MVTPHQRTWVLVWIGICLTLTRFLGAVSPDSDGLDLVKIYCCQGRHGKDLPWNLQGKPINDWDVGEVTKMDSFLRHGMI